MKFLRLQARKPGGYQTECMWAPAGFIFSKHGTSKSEPTQGNRG